MEAQPSSSSASSPSWAREKGTDAKRPSSQPQPQLLPALELLSSSPGLPNAAAARRQSQPTSSSSCKGASAMPKPTTTNTTTAHSTAYLKYPTPVPTSSTGILSSSPPRRVNNNNTIPSTILTRPASKHGASTSPVSERAPLSALPSVELGESGEPLLMGRSSNSSHFQLSASRLISRVHVRARYIPASLPLQPNKIEVACTGWNGLKLHCQGRAYDLQKGDAMILDHEGSEIMLDVQDARVLLHWPKKDLPDALPDLGWEDSPSSSPRRASPSRRDDSNSSPHRVSAADGHVLGLLQSSPLRRTARICSPESPTPAHASLQHALMHVDAAAPSGSQRSSELSELPSSHEREQSVEIYEDEDADLLPSSDSRPATAMDQSFVTDVNQSFSSDLSDPALSDDEQDDNGDENNPNEENDPIVHSFGPYGANLTGRMAAFSASSPKRRRLDSGAYTTADTARGSHHQSTNSADTSRNDFPTPPAPVIPDLSHVDAATIANHVVNQLAFSRLSSNPLSTLLANLPAQDKAGLTRDELRYIVETTECIGTIARQGKDADGKPLESQYYYIPEGDGDENRRAAVTEGLRKPTLRNCRKHHVQYYWKRPRTP